MEENQEEMNTEEVKNEIENKSEEINNNNNELCWKNVGSIAKGKEFIIYSYRQNGKDAIL